MCKHPDTRQAGGSSEIEVTREMVDAAIRAMEPYTEEGIVGYAHIRRGVTEALRAGLSVYASRGEGRARLSD